MKKLLFVSTWFQILWFLAVFGTYQWQWVLLLLVVGTLVSSHPENIKGYLFVMVLGMTVDSLNNLFGVFAFSSMLIPIWLVALWGVFAWYAAYLASIVSQYPKLVVVVLGGGAGALSYIAGEKFGAVEFGFNIYFTSFILFCEWACLIAAILRIYSDEKATHVLAIASDIACNSSSGKHCE